MLAEVGFLRVRAWGAGGHRGYVGRDPGTDRVLELDIEWCVAFGPSGHSAMNYLLGRRRRVEPPAVPDDDDALWALLLHCIVGRPLRTPGWDGERVLAAARGGRWPELVAVGTRLPARATLAGRVAAVGRGLPRLGDGWPRRGPTVTVMGPDGADKSTLTGAVAAGYGPPARVVDMGLCQSEGEGPGSAHPAAVLAAARRPLWSRRRAAVAPCHRTRRRLVVFDRHPFDALLSPRPSHVALKRVFFTLLARTVPASLLVLDVPVEVTARRRLEECLAALAAADGDYLALAVRLPQAVLFGADRPPDALRAAALDRIWQAALTDRGQWL